MDLLKTIKMTKESVPFFFFFILAALYESRTVVVSVCLSVQTSICPSVSLAFFSEIRSIVFSNYRYNDR